MPCYKPIHGWRSRKLTENGKRSIVFNPRMGYLDMPCTVPCGQCIGCKLEKARQWAIRCMHEAQLYKDNSFITLTFNDTHLPENGYLDIEIFKRFMKRLRRNHSGTTLIEENKIDRRGNPWTKKHYPIRLFYCGEYGSACKICGKSERSCTCETYTKGLGRPHFHACLFNYDFPDKYKWSKNKKTGDVYYRSPILEKLWPFGHSLIGDLTYESAGYTARYQTKKITGVPSEFHYCNENLVDDHGELYSSYPTEFAQPSRRPGIGKWWYEKYKDDVYPSDNIIIKGKKVKPPKFYDNLFEKEHPTDYAIIKHERKQLALSSQDNTYERLQTRELIQERKFKQLKRGYENE